MALRYVFRHFTRLAPARCGGWVVRPYPHQRLVKHSAATSRMPARLATAGLMTAGLMAVGLLLSPTSMVAAATPAADGVDSAALDNLLHQDCGSCHGMTLKGGLGPPLTSERLSAYDTDTLTTLILDGLPGTAMPPWRGVLSPQQAHWIADALKHQPAAPQESP